MAKVVWIALLSIRNQDTIVQKLKLKLARSQDQIGWRRFMGGMTPKEFCEIQKTYRRLGGSYLSGPKWAQSFSIKLIEMTHGQWLVRILLIHDKISGVLALERKEELQMAIEEQQEMGFEGPPRGG